MFFNFVQGRYISDITLEEVVQFTNLPANVACERLGLGLTSFKRLCRGLGIRVWPYKKEAAIAAAVNGSEYPPGSSNDGFGWSPPNIPATAGGLLRAAPAQPGSQTVSAHPQITTATAANAHVPPQLPAVGQRPDSFLRQFFREATAKSLVQLMDQVKQFSVEMKATLGVSIIDEHAVDLVRSACVAIDAANQPSPPSPQPVPPSPPLDNNPAAALLVLLDRLRGSV